MKLKLISKKHQQTSVMRSNEFINKCSDIGLKFVNKNEDITLIHTDAVDVRKNPTILKGRPVIIIERYDSANIGHYKELKSDSLLALWKISKFRDNITNTLPRYKGRYHSSLIMENRADKDKSLLRSISLLNDIDMNKVHVPMSYAHYDSTRIALKHSLNLKQSRSIDLHFCGTTMYDATESGSPISIHRMTCLRKLNSINGYKKIVHAGRPFSRSKYLTSIYNSKIIVSPWGCGEVCYRDFEALAAGCILLKPDTGFVETWPDIFINDKTYIPCNVDFSDLEDKIAYILKQWKSFESFRERNRKLIEDSIQMDTIVNRFDQLIKEAIRTKDLI